MNRSMVSVGRYIALVAAITFGLMIAAGTDDSVAADSWSSSTVEYRR